MKLEGLRALGRGLSVDPALAILKNTFGYPEFRGSQREIVDKAAARPGFARRDRGNRQAEA
jgi:superfamily II DNA helicase RecQ